MANDQEIIASGIANAQRFKNFLGLVSTLDRDSRRVIEFGSEAELIKALTTNKNKKLHFSVSAATQILAVRRDYYKYRFVPVAATQQRTQEDETKSAGSGKPGETAGSAFGILTAIPVGIYSYFNSPDRYSAKRLESEAQKGAKKRVKAIIKSAKKDFTENESAALYDKALMGYYADYVKWHRKRADQLAKTSSNQYLLTSIENANEDDQNRKSVGGVMKNKIQSRINISTPVVPAENENIQKDLTTFAQKTPSTRMPIGGPMAPRVSPASGPSMVGAPGKTTPKVPGNKRGLPHLPKPGLPGIPNPIQNIRTLAMFFNPSSIVALSLMGIFASVFFIVLFFGSAGGVAGGQPPSPGPSQPPISGTPPGQSLTCSGDYATCLLSNFNIVVNGAQGDDLHRLWESFAFAGQSKTYIDKLTKGGQRITITMIYDSQLCNGRTHGYAGTITIYGGASCAKTTFDVFRHFVIHEAGHVLETRNSDIYAQFRWTTYYSISPDSSCYDNTFLKTYMLRSGVDSKDESFAESIADTLTKFSYGPTRADYIHNFSIECPATYNYIDTSVFGGYSFY